MTIDFVIDEDQKAVNEVRKLVVDCCIQHGGGHGGSAIGMAPITVALWKYIMKYNPENPNWLDRDRFVLSNGHAAILLYAMLHVSGYKNFTMDELRGYAAPKDDGYTTICHGHPEIEIDGVEVTTGPLGQGIANSVGLAIAGKQLKSTFEKPGFPLFNGKIFCTTGDGCLQEGVAMESMAIAGHLGLDNLIVIYDNNNVTCDGPLDWIVSEDTNAKVRAVGWNTIDVENGDTSVQAIVDAIRLATTYTGKPTLINVRTTIGYATSKAGTAAAHHSTYLEEDAKAISQKLGDVSRPSHYISPETYKYFDLAAKEGARLEAEWNQVFESYVKQFPVEGQAFKDRLENKPINYSKILSSIKVPAELTAPREQNAYVFNELFERIPQMFIGGADLWGANKLGKATHSIFQKGNFGGRVVRYGIREHAMVSVSNGISAYQKGCFIPLTATFFMFYMYASPGVRMGALSDLRTIHIATHDSFAEGQNGPTHQPVELDSLFRAMPNFQYIRASDPEEILGAWNIALSTPNTPSMISVARDPPVNKIYNTCKDGAAKGGYVLVESENAVVTLISSGSEVQFALEASELLTASNISTRVVSMPCIKVFEEQSQEYRDKVLGTTKYTISVEPYIPLVWAKFCTASIGMKSWGYSASGASNYKRFGIDGKSIADKVSRYVSSGSTDKWIFLE